MNATLNAQSNTNYYPNLAIYTYYHTQPTGFQMLCSALHDPQRLGGTLNQALTAGVSWVQSTLSCIKMMPMRRNIRRFCRYREMLWKGTFERRTCCSSSLVLAVNLFSI